MNGIMLGCLMVVCLVGTITAQGRTSAGGSSSANTANLLRMYGAASAAGGSGGMGGMARLLPLMAMSGGGNDALMPLMFCRQGMNFMCMMALSQGGIL